MALCVCVCVLRGMKEPYPISTGTERCLFISAKMKPQQKLTVNKTLGVHY